MQCILQFGLACSQLCVVNLVVVVEVVVVDIERKT